MKCIICKAKATSYFTTDFRFHFGGKYKEQLEKSEYYKCSYCGFTFSKDVYEMSYTTWCELNLKAHTQFESTDLNTRLTNQPPYLAQATMLNLLLKDDIIGGGQQQK